MNLHDLPRATLLIARRRLAVQGTLSGLAGLVMLAAGLWFDWRWFPTSLIPFALCALSGYTAEQFERELSRRSTR